MTIASHKQPLYDQLVDILKERIENDLEPGDLLPSERGFSLRYGLSRTTVRQAMGELEALGLVTRVHGRGGYSGAFWQQIWLGNTCARAWHLCCPFRN